MQAVSSAALVEGFCVLKCCDVTASRTSRVSVLSHLVSSVLHPGFLDMDSYKAEVMDQEVVTVVVDLTRLNNSVGLGSAYRFPVANSQSILRVFSVPAKGDC